MPNVFGNLIGSSLREFLVFPVSVSTPKDHVIFNVKLRIDQACLIPWTVTMATIFSCSGYMPLSATNKAIPLTLFFKYYY